MNFDDLLGKLIPLFEKKMEFMMAMSERAMTLEEKKESNRTDLEYKKLETQLTTDREKISWEKEKLATTIRGDYDLQKVKDSGLLDVKRLEGVDAKEKTKIMEEAATARNKYSVDATSASASEKERGVRYQSNMTALGTILGHAVEKSAADPNNPATMITTKPTAEVGTAARSLMEQTGLIAPVAAVQPRNYEAEADTAMSFMKNAEAANDPATYQRLLQAQPVAVQTIIQSRMGTAKAQPAVAAAPAPAVVAPPTPVAAPTGIAPVATQANILPSAAAPTAAAPTTASTAAPPAFSPALPAGSPAKATGAFLGQVWSRGGEQAAAAVEQRKKDEEETARVRALRSARGVTVGNTF